MWQATSLKFRQLNSIPVPSLLHFDNTDHTTCSNLPKPVLSARSTVTSIANQYITLDSSIQVQKVPVTKATHEPNMDMSA